VELVAAVARAYTLTELFPLQHPTLEAAVDDAAACVTGSEPESIRVSRVGLEVDAGPVADPHGHVREFARDLSRAGVTQIMLPERLSTGECARFILGLRAATENPAKGVDEVLAQGGGSPIVLAFHGDALQALAPSEGSEPAEMEPPEAPAEDEDDDWVSTEPMVLEPLGAALFYADPFVEELLSPEEPPVEAQFDDLWDEPLPEPWQTEEDSWTDLEVDAFEPVDEPLIPEARAEDVPDDGDDTWLEPASEVFLDDNVFGITDLWTGSPEAPETEAEPALEAPPQPTVRTFEFTLPTTAALPRPPVFAALMSGPAVDVVIDDGALVDAPMGGEVPAAEVPAEQPFEEELAVFGAFDSALPTPEREPEELAPEEQEPSAPSPDDDVFAQQVAAFRRALGGEMDAQGDEEDLALPGAWAPPEWEPPEWTPAEESVTASVSDVATYAPDVAFSPDVVTLVPDPSILVRESETPPAELAASALPQADPAEAMVASVAATQPAELVDPASIWDPAPELEPAPEPQDPRQTPAAPSLVEQARVFATADFERRPILRAALEVDIAAAREAEAVGPVAEAVIALVLAATPGDDEPRALARALCQPDVLAAMMERLANERRADGREELSWVFGRLGGATAPALAEALSEVPPRAARRNYMDTLFGMGEDAVQVSLPMLEDSRWFIVRNGVDILGEAGTESAVHRLAPSLAHPDARVRRATVMALAKLGGPEAGSEVLPVLNDHIAEVREAAAMGVGHLQVAKAVRPLLAMLESDRSDDFQMVILRSLGQIGDPGAVPAIEKRAVGRFFLKPAKAVRIAAYRALAAIGTPHAKKLVQEAARDRDAEVAAIANTLLAS